MHIWIRWNNQVFGLTANWSKLSETEEGSEEWTGNAIWAPVRCIKLYSLLSNRSHVVLVLSLSAIALFSKFQNFWKNMRNWPLPQALFTLFSSNYILKFHHYCFHRFDFIKGKLLLKIQADGMDYGWKGFEVFWGEILLNLDPVPCN